MYLFFCFPVTIGGGGKKIRGTRIKNKLTDMENKRTNTWDKHVDDWIEKNEKK
jgi:hypothetical protein